MEIDVVNLLHLPLQHFGLHHSVEQYLVGAFDGGQYVKSLHEVGHTYIVMSLGFLLTCLQQVFVQQPIGMIAVELDVIGIVGVRMNPDGIFAAFEDTAEDGR